MTRMLFSSLSFMLTMVLGALAFAFTAYQYPTFMLSLFSSAESLRNQLSNLGVSDNYLVWINIVLQGSNLVLMGFIALARIFVAIVAALFNRRSSSYSAPQGQAQSPSPFTRWN